MQKQWKQTTGNKACHVLHRGRHKPITHCCFCSCCFRQGRAVSWKHRLSRVHRQSRWHSVLVAGTFSCLAPNGACGCCFFLALRLPFSLLSLFFFACCAEPITTPHIIIPCDIIFVVFFFFSFLSIFQRAAFADAVVFGILAHLRKDSESCRSQVVLRYTHTHTLSLSLSHSLSLTGRHTHTLSHIHTHSPSHMHTHTLLSLRLA